jgi:hypothetical protein
MKIQNVLRVVVVVACAMLIASPAVCGDEFEFGNNGQGVCRLDGAWLGTTPGWLLDWTVVYQSVSPHEGTLSMRFVGGDASLGGAFPATSLSRTTGSWVRTGRRTFDYTMIHFGLAADGQTPVFIGKAIGSLELSGSCDSLEVINWSLSIYDPAQDPFDDEPPIMCIPDGGISTAVRIPVQPSPC